MRLCPCCEAVNKALSASTKNLHVVCQSIVLTQFECLSCECSRSIELFLLQIEQGEPADWLGTAIVQFNGLLQCFCCFIELLWVSQLLMRIMKYVAYLTGLQVALSNVLVQGWIG